ncbi:Guanine nucleotide exchange factor lte1 [Rhodosporidiobolus nylandii]
MAPASPTSDARTPARRALPLSFHRPSSSTSPSPASGAEQDRDLAVAADGSFVETTSAAAAKAMARFYAQGGQHNGQKMEGTEYGVQKVERDGRTVYRIRVSLVSRDFGGARQEENATRKTLQYGQYRAVYLPALLGVRVDLLSRSIPLLRSGEHSPVGIATGQAGNSTLLSPVSAAFPSSSATGTAPVTPKKTLRSVGSSPTLSSVPSFSSSSGLAPAPTLSRAVPVRRSPSAASSAGAEGDVLGRILGWREGLEAGAGSRAKREGTARVGMPEMFRSPEKIARKGSGHRGKGSKGSKGSAGSDLPEDLREALSASLTPEHPFALSQKRPSISRTTTSSSIASPFGAGVRLPRLGTAETLRQPELQEQGERQGQERHMMREVSSTDSIRTARADDPASHVPPPLALPPFNPPPAAEEPNSLASLQTAAAAPRRRFEDPSVFDVFHRSSLASQPSPASPSPSSPPAPLGTHGRLPSSASLASSVRFDVSTTMGQRITVAAGAGGAGDDPRFVIWGTQDAPSSATVGVGPGSPPPGTRRSSAVAASPPQAGRYDGGDLRRQSIAESPGASSPAGSSRRWSISQRGSSASGASGSGGISSPATSVRDSVGSSPGGAGAKEHPLQRILMAATVERLVAELTSEISAELLPDFFLTYRHYLAPLDLLRLLLTRFDWAMDGPPSSVAAALSAAQQAEDDALRRVVRVRTFVVLRYWLMNSHFMEDFYPSPEMRTTLTTWLNEAARDERFKASEKDMRLIKQLKKTVRRCKEAYVLGGALNPVEPEQQEHWQGRTIRKEGSEEDVDFEGPSAAAASSSTAAFAASTASFTTPPTSAPATSSGFAFASLRGRGKLFSPSSSFSGPAGALPPQLSPPAGDTPSLAPFLPLPADPNAAQQNPIARSFASAVGTFGRFRRKLASASRAGSASGSSAAGAAEADGRGELELERSEAGDLLWVKGGLERYLEYWDIRREPDVVEEEEETQDLARAQDGEGESAPSAGDARTLRPLKAPAGVEEVQKSRALAAEDSGVGLGLGLGVVTSDRPADVAVQPVASVDYVFPPKPAIRQSSPTRPPIPSFEPLPPAPAPAYTFTLDPSLARPALRHSRRIELDDLSDSSDDDDDVIEVKKTLKRLPGATNLRLAATGAVPSHLLERSAYRRSMESEMSYGFGGASGLGAPWTAAGEEPPRESVLFVDDEAGLEAGEGVTVIPNFLLEGLLDSDDDEEPGDVEAALRRLEGFVDDAKEREKKRRVERQMEKSSRLEERRRRRQARIDAGEDVEDSAEDEESEMGSRKPSLAPTEEEETPPVEDQPVALLDVPEQSSESSATASPAGAGVGAPSLLSPPPSSPPPAQPHLTGYASSQSPPLTRVPSGRAKAATHSPTQPPVQAPSFRKPSISRIFGTRPLSARPGLLPPSSSSAAAPPTHRSFLLFCRTETLSQTFCLIERDLLRTLGHQELVSNAWRETVQHGETDVLDWEAYLKERRRSEVEAKMRGQVPQRSAVQDIVARFNVSANWCASEILLTANVDERAILIAKFIRLAFKCYCQSNFATMVQLVHGLQIPHVERLRRTWAKVPAWEMRKFRGMQEFVSHLKNFKHLRELTNALVADHGVPGQRSPAIDAITAGATKGCIPFLGLFLRDLALNAELPSFLDPSSPSTPANISPSGMLTSLASPSAFASLPPLPPSVPLAPLVNVHKFRVLASVVRRVLTFKELADRYAFEPEPSVYFKCLKIRALSQSVMSELSVKLEP